MSPSPAPSPPSPPVCGTWGLGLRGSAILSVFQFQYISYDIFYHPNLSNNIFGLVTYGGSGPYGICVLWTGHRFVGHHMAVGQNTGTLVNIEQASQTDKTIGWPYHPPKLTLGFDPQPLKIP